MKKACIDDLPDEVLQLCFARLSLPSIAIATAVCNRWRKLAPAPELFKLRKALGFTQACTYMLDSKYEEGLYKGLQGYMQMNLMDSYAEEDGEEEDGVQMLEDRAYVMPIKRPLALLEGPQRLQFAATVSGDGALLYIVGGRSPLISRTPGSWMVFRRVDVYDPVLNRWHQTKPMKIQRYACGIGSFVGISNDLNAHQLIVAGGYGMDGLALSSAEIYDHVIGEWKMIPSMQKINGACKGVGFQGKFYVKMANNGPNAAEVYDPLQNSWSIIISNQELGHLDFHNSYMSFSSLKTEVVFNI